MRSAQRLCLVGLSAAAILAIASCAGPRTYRAAGPNPQPRGHAYGNKHVHGYDLVYDSSCGLYVVVGMTDCYYDDGLFYRVRGGVWEVSVRADTWRVVAYETLPARLKVKSRPVAKVNLRAPDRPNEGGPLKVKVGAVRTKGNAPHKPARLAKGKP